MGFVPLSKTGAGLLFEIVSQNYERGPIIITLNLPFDEWAEVFRSERQTGSIPDRLTHHVHILKMKRREPQAPSEPQDQVLRLGKRGSLELAFGQ